MTMQVLFTELNNNFTVEFSGPRDDFSVSFETFIKGEIYRDYTGAYDVTPYDYVTEIGDCRYAHAQRRTHIHDPHQRRGKLLRRGHFYNRRVTHGIQQDYIWHANAY
jgi:hypothetical protein